MYISLFLFHDMSWYEYFFDMVRNKLQTIKISILKLIKRRSKVQEKNMSCERALKFVQWKTFSENYKPMRVWLWFVYKFTENYFLRVHSNSKEVSYLSWQNRYGNLKTNCHIELKIFLWTKLLESLLLAKYLISVVVTLTLFKYIYKISIAS